MRLLTGLLATGLLLSSMAAQAEKADRRKPMTLESNPCTVNLAKQITVCTGNVVITQGTLQIRAERLELRETPDGYQLAQAVGTDGLPARYRQKRDGVDEYVEGQARRIDYDSKTGVLKFDGQAQVRRLRGSVTADEIQGATIVWDSQAELFSVQGGAVTPGNPSGRVRAVIAPRAGPEEPASAPSAASSAPLRSSPALGDRR